MERKYEFTGEKKKYCETTLHRIRAVRDFGNVKKGDLGGFIESEDNLSHDGTAWVYGWARVYGDAWVYGNARIYGNAQIYGNARICGNAQIYGDAWVCLNACICDNARIYGDVWIYGNSDIRQRSDI